MQRSPGEYTEMLAQLRNGNRDAEAQLYQVVYQERRHVAAKYLRQERPNHTLQPQIDHSVLFEPRPAPARCLSTIKSASIAERRYVCPVRTASTPKNCTTGSDT